MATMNNLNPRTKVNNRDRLRIGTILLEAARQRNTQVGPGQTGSVSTLGNLDMRDRESNIIKSPVKRKIYIIFEHGLIIINPSKTPEQGPVIP